jgi:hypothetical protein
MPQIDSERDRQKAVERLSATHYQEMRDSIFKRTDRILAGLMVFQWLAAITAALLLSPKTWNGPHSHTPHSLWIAIFIGGVITVTPVTLALFQPGKVLTPQTIAVAEMLTSALLIHLTGGRIETHFHIFGALAFLAFYRDWRVLITASIVVAVHHCMLGMYSPDWLYGVHAIQPWRWAEHAGWIVFEDVFLIISIVQSLNEMKAIADRQAGLEVVNADIEQQVHERTVELHDSESRLRESETKLRKIFDATHDVILINRLSDGGLIDANMAFGRSGIKQSQEFKTSSADLWASSFKQEWDKYADDSCKRRGRQPERRIPPGGRNHLAEPRFGCSHRTQR